MEECWYDEFGIKKVKSCKDDTRIPPTEVMDKCSNMHCTGNTPDCAPTCTGCGTKVEFCGQGNTLGTKILVRLLIITFQL